MKIYNKIMIALSISIPFFSYGLETVAVIHGDDFILRGDPDTLPPRPPVVPEIPPETPNALAWGQYWHSVSSLCHENSAMAEGDHISSEKSGYYCYDNRYYCMYSLNSNNFPSGSFGVETLGEVHLGRYCKDNQKPVALNYTYMFDGVKNVTGFLWLESNNLSDVDGLNDLVSVGREFKLQDNKLQNLNGLQSLETVNGSFSLRNNLLTDIDGLLSLKTVKGTFDLSNNQLTNLNGLISLDTVSGDLNLSGNNIRDYRGLSNLKDVGGLIYIDDAIDNESYLLPKNGSWCENQVYNYISTKSFDKAHNLFAKACGWSNTDSDQVPSPNGWGKYWNSLGESCHSKLPMKDGDSISEVDSGRYCYDNNYYCMYSMNPNKFPSGSFGVKSLGDVHLGRYCKDNQKPSTLNETYMFDGVEQVNGFLWLESNNLLNVDGLNDLVSIGREFRLQDNKLINIDGLSKLENVNGYINIKNNNLKDVNGLTSLNTVNGFIDLSNNNIENLNGLRNLNNLSGNLVLTGNNISDYSGLSNLETMGGLIYIDDFVDGNSYILPTNGKWCENKIYNFISSKSFEKAHVLFAKACGWDENSSDEVPNANGWGKYWNSLSSQCHSNAPMSNGDHISEVDSGRYCYDNRYYCVNYMDYNKFPPGSFGVETLGKVHLGRYCNDNSKPKTLNYSYMFDGVKNITGFLWLESNKLTEIDGLNDLVSVDREIKLQDNLLTNVNGLRSLKSVKGYLNLTNNKISDYTGLRSLVTVDKIHVDEPSGILSWPNSGDWCLNSTYLKLDKPNAQTQAEADCN